MRKLILASILILSQAGAGQTANQNVDAQVFRSIFTNLVDKDEKNPVKLNHLIYAPVPNLLSDSDKDFAKIGVDCATASLSISESTARKTLCGMQKKYAAASAETFYRQGLSTGKVEVDLEELTKNLQQKDLLIVLVPGIFGEFIKGRAFEEVFEKNSAFKQQFDAALAQKTKAQIGSAENCGNVANEVSVCGTQELLKRMTLEPGSTGAAKVHMSHLLNVASIDDVEGDIAAKVILFQMDGMTLESLGRQQDKAAIFNSRLKKFFEITGHVPKNIAFVGYSRGTAFALEMLSQALQANEPWLNNVRAVVSMGGVVLGSALADDVFKNSSNPANCQLQLENMLEDILTEVPDLNVKLDEGENKAIAIRNTMGWYRFLLANARFASKKLTCDQVKDLRSNKIDKDELKIVIKGVTEALMKQAGTDPNFGRQLILAQAVKFGLIPEGVDMSLTGKINFIAKIGSCLATNDFNICLKEFGPSPAKYNTDIRRFRRLVLSARQGVEELTTDSRLNWWQTHTIPTKGIRFYSVSGTMADPNTELGNNRDALNPKSPDDNGLIQNWKDFSDIKISGEYAGVNLNDSQVAIYKTAFWPNIIASLNPENKGVLFTPLAVVGTHHWGMALPIVNEVRSSSGLLTRNPFPRAELLQAIALSIAEDIRVDAEKGQ